MRKNPKSKILKQLLSLLVLSPAACSHHRTVAEGNGVNTGTNSGATSSQYNSSTTNGNPSTTSANDNVNDAAATEAKSNAYVEIDFDKHEKDLTADDKRKIQNLVTSAQGHKNIDEVVVAVWPDQEYPAKGQKLSKAQRDLANDRAKEITRFLKEDCNVKDVDKVSMAERPSLTSEFFKTESAKIKTAFEESGVATTASAHMPYKSSKAVIMVVPKNKSENY
jgi:hypothetical protein